MEIPRDTPLFIFLVSFVIFCAYFCLAGLIHRQIGVLQTGGGPGMGIVIAAPLIPAAPTAGLTYWALSCWGMTGGVTVGAICVAAGLVAMYWARRGNSQL